MNQLDLTNFQENSLDSPCWLNELWESGTRVPSVGLTNFKVCQVCSAITCWPTQYPLSWVNNSFYPIWGIVGVVSVCPYKAKLLKIQNNRPRAHLPISSGTAGCPYAGIRRVRNEYVTQITCGARTPMLPTGYLVKMALRVDLTKFSSCQVDLTNCSSKLNVGLTNFSSCQVDLTNCSPNLNLDSTKIFLR